MSGRSADQVGNSAGYDVFLSYAREDVRVAESLVKDLEHHGLGVWSDLALRPGDDWQEHIESALTSAEVVLVLLSPASVESSWVTSEWSKALAESKTVVPVVTGGQFHLLPGVLATRQALDYDPADSASVQPLVAWLLHLREERARASAPTRSAGRFDDRDIERIVAMTVEQVLERTSRQPAAGTESSVTRLSSQIFVVTSFNPDLEPIHEAIQAAAAAVGLVAHRVKDVPGDYRITDRIFEMIRDCRFIVADLTYGRPNVYFELGYARGIGKRVVTILRSGTDVHFDVQDWTYLSYTDSRPLERDLVKRFRYEMSVDSAP